MCTNHVVTACVLQLTARQETSQKNITLTTRGYLEAAYYAKSHEALPDNFEYMHNSNPGGSPSGGPID